MSSPTLDALRLTKKGGLIYDKHWLEDGRIEEVIEYCSSPPQISLDLLAATFNRLNFSQQDVDEETNQADTERAERNSSATSDHSYAKGTIESTGQHQTNQSSYVDRALLQCEQEWEDLVKERVRERQWQLQEHSRQVQEQAEQNVTLLAQQRELKQQALVQMMRQTQREMDEKREKRLQHQQERHRLHLKRLDAKMKAAVLQREADEMVRKKREKERQDFLRSLTAVKNQVDETARRIMQLLISCPHKEHLSKESTNIGKSVQTLSAKAGSLVEEAGQSEMSRDLGKTMREVLESLRQKQEEAIKAVAEAEKNFQEEVTRKEKEKEKEQAEKEKAKKVEESQASNQATTSVSLASSVSPEALAEYTSLDERHKALEEVFKGLTSTTDKDLKKYRFDLQKAVNTPINAVSVQSASHLLDKLGKLRALLSGREVEMGTRRVLATKPAGITYCKDLAAKKLVKQGDEQISSNHEFAFPFAAIILALWQEIPDFGDLVLYHFYQRCPFLLPYHIPKKEEQSLEDYYKCLGYTYDSDGQIEKQDKYLKRMSGYTRLFAAVIVSPPVRGKAHPHGLDRGWMFLSRVMNLDPQPDITATTLFDFLEVCSHAMADTYGKQFFKLLQTLYRHYFPRIQAVTPQGSGGPVTRLQGFLEDCLRTQRVPPPKGFLTADFWRS
ncbi:mRNA export factor GLE1-like [Diadema antillarum]|uniref:mRNA export factor GLE1-like n=1 Tax=Diadema antillarum TaxID=105358 RepID=UPI003A872A15